MNKHHVIRSVFVTLIIALIYGLSVVNFNVIQFGHPQKMAVNAISWHPEKAAEVEFNHFNFEHEFTTQADMPEVLWAEEHLSIFAEDVLDESEFKSFDNDEPCGKRSFFIIKPLKEGL